MIPPKNQILLIALNHANRHLEVTTFKTIDEPTRQEHKELSDIWTAIADFVEKRPDAPAAAKPAKFDPLNDYPDHGEQA